MDINQVAALLVICSEILGVSDCIQANGLLHMGLIFAQKVVAKVRLKPE
jgi:hypothetical protein